MREGLGFCLGLREARLVSCCIFSLPYLCFCGTLDIFTLFLALWYCRWDISKFMSCLLYLLKLLICSNLRTFSCSLHTQLSLLLSIDFKVGSLLRFQSVGSTIRIISIFLRLSCEAKRSQDTPTWSACLQPLVDHGLNYRVLDCLSG
jgi:hypothetical protein